MLALTPNEVADSEALIDLYAATARQAVLDLCRGPAVVGHRHYATAVAFLRALGVLDSVLQHYGIALESVNYQLELDYAA